jgi:hypothetical protein
MSYLSTVMNVGKWILVCTVATGCQTAVDSESGVGVKVFQEDGTLDDIKFDGNAPGATLPVDRDRRGVEIEWGDGGLRKFAQVFTEKFATDLPTLDRSPSVRMFGVRGGMRGAIGLGNKHDDLTYRLPWAIDAALIAGEENGADPDIILYGEFAADFGFGLHWLGFTPSFGLAVSNVTGKLIPPYSGPGAPASTHEAELGISGISTGFYFEIGFKHRKHPWYAQFRTQTGDYENTTMGIGFRF